MRISNSIKNSISAFILSFLTMIVGFISRAVFIRIMNVEYLGLNGLFSNILSMLSIFELGIGSAIIYNLYKPIANNKIEEVKALMLFYKKSYNIIALCVLVCGLLLIPFLKYIVGDVTVNVNIIYVYILFLMSTVCSYIVSYKRSLIYANQKNYIINIIHILYVIILNLLQLLILYFTKNFYYYLIILIICQIIENIFISFLADRLYPYLKDKNVNKLDKNVEKNIFKNVKALLFHKIGYSLVLGTDNIIISSFLGVVYVGLYSNYLTIINSVNSLVAQLIESTIASIGNLLVSESKDKSFDVFRKIRFFNFWLACFTAICILVIIQPFIKIWIGEKYLLSTFVLIILVFNYYQKMMRRTHSAFKDASGTWEEDKFIPLIESFINLISSIILLKIFGLSGVFMGTIISGLCLWAYSYPKFVYKKLFDRSYKNYAKETIGYLLIFIVVASITYVISLLISINNVLLQVIINLIICIIVPNLLLFLIFRKTDSFIYFVELIKKIFNKIVRK